MIFNQATSAGVSADSTEQGSWFTEAALCPGGDTVTVNAHIEATWSPGSDATSWHWWDLQDGFASTLWGVMQAVSNPTGYENYSQKIVVVDVAPAVCEPGEFVDWGHYIPTEILITAYDNDNHEAPVGQVKVTYSTEESGQSGGNICGFTAAAEGVLALFPQTSTLAGIFGVGTILLPAAR